MRTRAARLVAGGRATFTRDFGVYPIYGLAVVTALFCGVAVARAQHLFQATPSGAVLFCLLASAYLAITLSIQPELLFAFWIFAAPLFQESGSAQTRIAKDLGLVLYTFPPLILFLVLLLKGSSRPLRLFDAFPALYFLYILLSAKFVTSHVDGLSHNTHLRGLYLTVGIGIVAYYFVALAPTTPRLVTRVCYALLASASVIAAMALVEGLTGWNLWHDMVWRGHGISRAVATLANPAVLGTFLGMVVVLAVAILLWNGPAPLRRPSKIFLALSIPALYFTYTRGPMIGAGVVVVMLVILSARARWYSVLILAIACGALVILSSQFTSSSVYQSRFGDTHNIQTRLILQKASFTLAAKRPLFGWGYGSFNTVKNSANLQSADPASLAYNTSHNSFLTVLVELGVVGLALFLLPWLIICARAVPTARRRTEVRWLLAGIVGAVAVYFVSASTYDARFFSFVPALPWILLGIARRVVDDDEVTEPALP